MRRFLQALLFVLVCAGCNPARAPNTDEVSLLVHLNSGLSVIELQPFRESRAPRFIEYCGTATDDEGIVYDLSVDVSRDTVEWYAVPRPRFLRKDQAEEVAKRLLDLSDATLNEEKPGAFSGFGFDVAGKQHQLRGSTGTDLLNRHVFTIKMVDDDGFDIRTECYYEKLPAKWGSIDMTR